MPKATKWATSFVLFFILIFNSATAGAESKSVIVDTKSLNIRSGPGLTYAVVGAMKKGDRIDITKTSGDWLQIDTGTQEGWIASWLVTPSNGPSTTSSKIVSRVDSLNIRSGPSIGSAILGRMDSGDEALLTGRDGSWSRVVVNGKTGWVHEDYITEVTGQTEHVTNEVKVGEGTFTVAVDALNVRKNADLSSKRVGLITKDESYEIKETNGNWIRISYEKENSGWVYSFHGTISSASTNTKVADTNSESVTILSNGTNIRESATTASSIATRANAGERFKVTSESNDWYEVELPNGELAFVAKWVVSTNNETVSGKQTVMSQVRAPGTLQGLTIVIDPGHGGNDRGSTGARGTDEKNITLLTSELLAAKLKAAGANVQLTRETDTYVSLRKRVAVSHQFEADAFISIHYDATTTASVAGFTTYYTHQRQKELATNVNNGLSTSITLRNRGTQPGDYLVLRENRQNAILIELGFLSNPGEELTVTTNKFREQATLGIYNGLLDYFNSN